MLLLPGLLCGRAHERCEKRAEYEPVVHEPLLPAYHTVSYLHLSAESYLLIRTQSRPIQQIRLAIRKPIG